MASINEDYLIPLVIGVTSRKGTVADEERLSGLISGEMVRLRNTFPNSPFIVISSLAEREERLTARLAIEHLRARLIAILPQPPEQCVNTLQNDINREDFSRILDLAESSLDISSLMQLRLGVKRYDLLEDSALRESFTAAFIAEHSEILFAICADETEGETDTTAQIINWIREGSITREFSLRESKTGLDNLDKSMIISINPITCLTATESAPPEENTEAANDESGDQTGFMRSILSKFSGSIFGFVENVSDSLDNLYDYYFKHTAAQATDKYEKSPFINIIERIDGFNLDIRNYYEGHGEQELNQSKKYLLQSESDNELISDNPTLQRIISLYSGADVLSQYYQKKTSGLINWIYALFLVAVLLYGLINMSSYLVLFYIGLIPAIALLVKKSLKDRVEDRFLDYRALAEGLRVQVFWTLCGINENVSSHYLSKYEGLLTWIRKAVRSIEIMTLRTDSGDGRRDKSALVDITKRLWIDSQLDYFRSKRRPIFMRSRQFGNVVFLSFVFTLLTDVVYGAYVLIAGVDNGKAINDFQILLGVIAAVGVAAQAYKNKKAYDELERRYSLAQQIYAAAKRELEIGKVPAEKILVAVGREALLENSDWLWTHRNVPIELPKG